MNSKKKEPQAKSYQFFRFAGQPGYFEIVPWKFIGNQVPLARGHSKNVESPDTYDEDAAYQGQFRTLENALSNEL